MPVVERPEKAGGKAAGGLTPKQRAFIAEYLVDLNAAQAAVRAGYSPRTAKAAGCRLLSSPAVAEAVADAQAGRAARVGVTADETLRQIDEIARSDLRRLFGDDGELLPPKLWPDDAARAVASIEIVTRRDVARRDGNGDVERVVERVAKIRFWDKPRALELKARHLGMFSEAPAVSLVNFAVVAEPGPETAEQWLEEHAPKAPKTP